jgi:hypothetical protein
LEPGSTLITVIMQSAAADTTGTHTFSKAFSASPTPMGVIRVDAVAATTYAARFTITGTQITIVLNAAATGTETFYVTLLGKIAPSA